MLAQYGSEVKEPMMDPKAKPKDMFSTVNIRLGDNLGLAGRYSQDLTDFIKRGDDIIKKYGYDSEDHPLANEDFVKNFLASHKKRKTQTPYDRAQEDFRLGEEGLRDKPESFMPTKDASFVSLRQSDHIAGKDKIKDILNFKGTTPLTDPANAAITFIHEARHKAVQKLNLRPVINETLGHIPIKGGAEEVLMRFMDYKNSTTPEEKENQKKWVINYYEYMNNFAEQNNMRTRFTDPFQDTRKGKQEFKKLDELSNLVNTVAKKALKNLRGVPVYEDKDYPESFMEKVNRKGIFRTMFPQNVGNK